MAIGERALIADLQPFVELAVEVDSSGIASLTRILYYTLRIVVAERGVVVASLGSSADGEVVVLIDGSPHDFMNPVRAVPER